MTQGSVQSQRQQREARGVKRKTNALELEEKNMENNENKAINFLFDEDENSGNRRICKNSLF